MLLYLSAMGDGLSSILRCLFRKVRSCGGGKRRNNGSNSSGGSSSNNSSSSSSTGGKVPDGVLEKSSHGLHGNGLTGNSKFMQSAHKYNYPTHYHQQHQPSSSVPISICIMILICYVSLGALLFHRIQSWGVLESIYFCFTSLGTIGFGDLSPKGNIAQYSASAYILVGMAVVAMCFSLIQTELIMWLRKFGVQDQQQTYPASNSGGPSHPSTKAYNHYIQSQHHNRMMHQMPSVDQTEDVAMVTVAVTPKS